MILDQRELQRRKLLRFKGVEEGCAFIGPATVQIHLTNLCNLACQYCYYYGPENPNPPDGKTHLSFENFIKVIRDCVDLKVDTIYLSGEGDPTLHPRFYEMLDYLRAQPLSVAIYSNATFPIERCHDILLGADRIVINLGSADRTTYRQVQGRDLFMKVIRNIRQLSKLKPQLNPDFHIEVVFIANRFNIESQSKTETLVKKLGADLICTTIAEITENNHHIKLPDYQEKMELTGEWPPCFHGWFYSAIKINGNVNVCCFMQQLTIGNAYATSFKQVWESEAYTRARRAALTGDSFKKYHECINCRAAWRNKEIARDFKKYSHIIENRTT